MEVCGGQTHAIVSFGIDELLPPSITLVHGPGCPVCVTPVDMIDKAIEIAGAAGRDLLLVRRHAARARQRRRPACGQGARRRRAHRLFAARRPAHRPRPTRTRRWCSSPSASRRRRRPTPWRSTRRSARAAQFSVLVSHVLVPPAMEAILSSPSNRVQGFLAAGHVCTVMGFRSTSRSPRVPRPDRRHRLRAARHPAGHLHVRAPARERARRGREPVRAAPCAARATSRRSEIMREVFRVVPRKWRGIGEIPRERARPARGVSRLRRRGALRRGRPQRGASRRVHQRPGPPAASTSRPSARPSARAARPSIRSAPPWSPPRAPAPPITATARVPAAERPSRAR